MGVILVSSTSVQLFGCTFDRIQLADALQSNLLQHQRGNRNRYCYRNNVAKVQVQQPLLFQVEGCRNPSAKSEHLRRGISLGLLV